jgi:ABC-type nitrate/sulfonate/bicarbonate transport system substrate-binding protein
MRGSGSALSVPMLVAARVIAVAGIQRIEAQPHFPRIVIGVGPDAGFTQFVVGVREGIFARQGINAAIQLFPAGPATLEAVLAGNADVGSSSQFTFTAMLQKGGKFKIISQLYTSANFQCAVAKANILKPGDLLG